MIKRVLKPLGKRLERPWYDNTYIQMDNMGLTDDNERTEDRSATIQRQNGASAVSFAVGTHSTDQCLFEDDEKNLINSRHSVCSDEEEMQSPVAIRRKPVYDEDMWWKTSELEGLGQYDDFHTIDWCRDRIRDRMRFRQMKKMKLAGTWSQKLKVYNFKFGTRMAVVPMHIRFLYSQSKKVA